MIADYISEIRQYLPCSYFIDGASDYVEYVSNACVFNAEKEKYQFSFLAFHMLYMTFIYKIIWQSNQIGLSGLDRRIQQYEGHLHPFNSPFRLSVINEKDVIKFLRCHGFHSNKTDQFERPVDDRNHCAHASGFVQYRTDEDIDALFKPIVRYIKEIQEKQKDLLKLCFEQYFSDNFKPEDTSSLFPSGMDSVNRFIKDRMLSLKDLETIAQINFDFLSQDSENSEVIYKKVFYLLIIGKLEQELGEDIRLSVEDAWPVLERGFNKQEGIKLQDLLEQELGEISKFMGRKDKIKKALYAQYSSGQRLKRSEIIACVQKFYPEIPEGSLLPSDFCENHNNKDPFSGKYHIFRRLQRGLYELL